MRVAGPHRVYGSQDYAMSDGVLEVYAIEPIGGHRTQHSHDEVQSYVVYWLHIRMYTVQILWLVRSGCRGW